MRNGGCLLRGGVARNEAGQEIHLSQAFARLDEFKSERPAITKTRQELPKRLRIALPYEHYAV